MQSRLAWIFAIALLLLGVLTVFSERNSQAHEDPPGAPRLQDWVEIELWQIKEIEDTNPETCVEIYFRHPNHGPHLKDPEAPQWLHFFCWNGEWDDDKVSAQNPITIIGEGGRASWSSPHHTECFPTEAWEISLNITELEKSAVPDVLKKVGEALGKSKKPNAIIAGAIVETIGSILSELLAGDRNIGTVTNAILPAGTPDPSGKFSIDRNLEFRRYKFTKVVQPLADPEFAKCSQPSTPSPTPTPTPTPTQTPAPTSTRTPTPNPTPTPHGCPLDQDCDEVIDPFDQCPGIPGPPPTGCPRSQQVYAQHPLMLAQIEPEDFGVDENHPFSRSLAYAAGSWRLLREAAVLIDEVRPEAPPDGPNGPVDVTETKQLLIQLVGEVAQFTASVEVEEAEGQPTKVNAATLQQAQNLLAEGDQILQSALADVSTQDLLRTLERYRSTFELVVVQLHPELNITSSITLPLVDGWNLASKPLVGTSPAELFDPIADDLVVAWALDSSIPPNGRWLSYSPDAPSSLNTLTHIDGTMGFWLSMGSGANLVMSGLDPVATDIRLYGGRWNLIGYPSQQVRPLEDLLAGIDYDVICTYRAQDAVDPWKCNDPSVPAFLNDLTEFAPGQGYLIFPDQDTTITVNEG